MMGLTLFSTEGCHLCEQAQQMLSLLGIEYHIVDVVDLPDGLTLFGTRIPVVGFIDGPQLDWPFSILDLNDFCTQAMTD